MRRIRVLVVDDAVVVRRMLSNILATDAAVEVVGAAANGRIALARIPQVNPDVVTLDVEMPECDGLETLVAIRRSYPLLPVIMVSTQTESPPRPRWTRLPSANGLRHQAGQRGQRHPGHR